MSSHATTPILIDIAYTWQAHLQGGALFEGRLLLKRIFVGRIAYARRLNRIQTSICQRHITQIFIAC